VNGAQTRQLFDIQNDPLEMTNLASEPANALQSRDDGVVETRMKDTGDHLDLDKPDWGYRPNKTAMQPDRSVAE